MLERVDRRRADGDQRDRDERANGGRRSTSGEVQIEATEHRCQRIPRPSMRFFAAASEAKGPNYYVLS
jgi:hypothetical protein